MEKRILVWDSYENKICFIDSKGGGVQQMDTAKQLSRCYTIDDIYALPDGERAELIDGDLYMMSAPGMKHQYVVMELSYRIRDFIGKHNGSCQVFPAPFAVFLNADNTVYLEPDICVICDKNKLTDEGCKGAPDWVIEVVSPGSRAHDYNKKMLKYGTAGVREYWIADTEKDRIMVYSFERETMEEFSFSDKVKAGIFENLEIDFSEILQRMGEKLIF